ncbi:LOW QUALITY PROTEIN: adenosine deaminase, partial [Micromonospora sp. ATCC 39149]
MVAISYEDIVKVPKALLHDHLDGGLRPATIVELAAEVGHELPTTDPEALGRWFVAAANSGSLERYLETFAHTVAVMQTAPALRRVAQECALDLAADGVVYAEVRFAPEQHLERDLTLDEVVEAVVAGFAEGAALAADAGHPIRVGTLLTAMRHAARSQEIAELAVRHRDAGVVGFDIAGAEAGFPPTRHLDAFEYLQRENFHFTIHAGEAFGLPSIWQAIQWCGADRLGHGVRIVDDITPGDPPVLGRLAAYVRDKRIPLELCPSSNVQTGAAASIAEHKKKASARSAVPGDGEHRQPADERHLDVPGDGAAGGGLRLRLEGAPMVHHQRDEERVHPVRRAAGHHRRGDQAGVREAAGL